MKLAYTVAGIVLGIALTLGYYRWAILEARVANLEEFLQAYTHAQISTLQAGAR